MRLFVLSRALAFRVLERATVYPLDIRCPVFTGCSLVIFALDASQQQVICTHALVGNVWGVIMCHGFTLCVCVYNIHAWSVGTQVSEDEHITGISVVLSTRCGQTLRVKPDKKIRPL